MCFFHFQMHCLNIRKIKNSLSFFFYMAITDTVCTSVCLVSTGIYMKLQTYGKSKPDEPLNEIYMVLLPLPPPLPFASCFYILSLAM